MDIMGAIIAGFIFIAVWLLGVWLLFSNPGLVLVISGVCLGIGVLVWPLLKE